MDKSRTIIILVLALYSIGGKAQILNCPDQSYFLYVDSICEKTIPDFRELLFEEENQLDTIIQKPVPGTLLESSNQFIQLLSPTDGEDTLKCTFSIFLRDTNNIEITRFSYDSLPVDQAGRVVIPDLTNSILVSSLCAYRIFQNPPPGTDLPYARAVEVNFEIDSRFYQPFSKSFIYPAVQAPYLECKDGTLLLDSAGIVDMAVQPLILSEEIEIATIDILDTNGHTIGAAEVDQNGRFQSTLCSFIGQTLDLRMIDPEGGFCTSRVSVNQHPEFMPKGKFYSSWCLFPRNPRSNQNTRLATVEFPCGKEVELPYLGDWVFDNNIENPHVKSVIHREYDLTPFLPGQTYFDTIQIFKMPQIDSTILFSPYADTISILRDPFILNAFGPYMLLQENAVDSTVDNDLDGVNSDTIFFLLYDDRDSSLSINDTSEIRLNGTPDLYRSCGLYLDLNVEDLDGNNCENTFLITLNIIQASPGMPSPIAFQNVDQMKNAFTRVAEGHWRCQFVLRDTSSFERDITCYESTHMNEALVHYSKSGDNHPGFGPGKMTNKPNTNKVVRQGTRLFQNRPNPFRDQTVIDFYLPSRREVKMTIFDIHGRIVFQLLDDYNSGFHQITLREAIFPLQGIYFYSMETLDFRETIRFLKLP